MCPSWYRFAGIPVAEKNFLEKERYNILWGHSPDKLYHSYLVMGNRIEEKRIGALVNGQDCYVRIDSFNENGITYGMVSKL